jgi:hypothetical protein
LVYVQRHPEPGRLFVGWCRLGSSPAKGMAFPNDRTTERHFGKLPEDLSVFLEKFSKVPFGPFGIENCVDSRGFDFRTMVKW